MKIEHLGEIFEACLIDDGTLDTVISINGHEVRISQEYASEFRDKNGVLSDKEFIEMVKEEIDLDCEGLF